MPGEARPVVTGEEFAELLAYMLRSISLDRIPTVPSDKPGEKPKFDPSVTEDLFDGVVEHKWTEGRTAHAFRRWKNEVRYWPINPRATLLELGEGYSDPSPDRAPEAPVHRGREYYRDLMLRLVDRANSVAAELGYEQVSVPDKWRELEKDEREFMKQIGKVLQERGVSAAVRAVADMHRLPNEASKVPLDDTPETRAIVLGIFRRKGEAAVWMALGHRPGLDKILAGVKEDCKRG
jgi:hypothetical protein